jgi:hypothetical protein
VVEVIIRRDSGQNRFYSGITILIINLFKILVIIKHFWLGCITGKENAMKI